MQMDSSTSLESVIRQRPMTDWQTPFWSALLLTIITCGIYGIYIIYKLMDRRQQHFERMILFRYNLIQLLREKAETAGRTGELEADLSQLEALHNETTSRDRMGEKSPVLWLVLGLVAGVIYFYVYYFLNDDFRAHEANEHMFMQRANEVMQKLGMSQQLIDTAWAVPERNFILYLILTIVTCGIYGIYWWYTLITDPNRHFDNHAVWESQIYTMVATQGETA